ncbi:hypothetical protein BFJ70_g8008 [Fusarium oxysporum]|nr:hypothetical protein BFJ70_g8008 [Fusarium oxysporum]
MESSSAQKSVKMKDKTSRPAVSKGDKAATKKKPDAEKILTAALNTNFNNKDEAAKFEAEFKDRFIRQSSAKNILCVLAYKDNLPRKIEWSDMKTKEFLDWILKSYHHLLEEKDKKNNSLTPLHLALTKDHTAFVNAILDSNLINMNKVLPVEGRDGNALHIALEKSPSSFEPLVQRCIEFPNMFKATHPTTRNTPLHDCMLVDLDDLDAEDEEYEENSEGENASEDGEYEQDSDDERTLSTTSEEGQLPQSSVGNQQPYVNESGHPEEFSLQRRQSTKVPGAYPDERLPFVEMLIESDKSALYCYNEKKRTPYQERIYQLEEYYKKAGGSTKKKDFEAWANNDPICEYIRLYCVTNLPRNEATKCLYNTGNEKQIEFDLGGLGRDTISQEYLDQLSNHLKFESILKYVALPKLIMEDPPRRPKPK